MKAIAFPTVTLLLVGVLQAVSSLGQTADPPAQKPLKIGAVTGFIHLLSKPELVYPEEALQQHIEGTVELELTVSPQGDVVSGQAVWGPPALRQATIDAFKKVKYIPFRRDGEPSVALVQAIVAYEKGQATISTVSEHAITPYASSVSTGSAVQQAARAVAAGPGNQQGTVGDFGLGIGAPGRPTGNIEILSDTQGVDFGPHPKQAVLSHVRANWYPLIPQSAQMKHGNLVIEFAIMKDGRVQGARIVTSSNDVALDRPAYGSIVASSPFPPLPTEFLGQYLALRFRFYYNPTKEELAPAKPTASAPAVK